MLLKKQKRPDPKPLTFAQRLDLRETTRLKRRLAELQRLSVRVEEPDDVHEILSRMPRRRYPGAVAPAVGRRRKTRAKSRV